MGDRACYLEFCPDCATPVPVVDGECPDCGAALDDRADRSDARGSAPP